MDVAGDEEGARRLACDLAELSHAYQDLFVTDLLLLRVLLAEGRTSAAWEAVAKHTERLLAYQALLEVAVADAVEERDTRSTRSGRAVGRALWGRSTGRLRRAGRRRPARGGSGIVRRQVARVSGWMILVLAVALVGLQAAGAPSGDDLLRSERPAAVATEAATELAQAVEAGDDRRVVAQTRASQAWFRSLSPEVLTDPEVRPRLVALLLAQHSALSSIASPDARVLLRLVELALVRLGIAAGAVPPTAPGAEAVQLPAPAPTVVVPLVSVPPLVVPPLLAPAAPDDRPPAAAEGPPADEPPAEDPPADAAEPDEPVDAAPLAGSPAPQPATSEPAPPPALPEDDPGAAAPGPAVIPSPDAPAPPGAPAGAGLPDPEGA